MRPLYFGILLFLIWSSLSTWYYVCRINDFCDGPEGTQQVSGTETQPESDTAAVVEPEPAEAALPVPGPLNIHFAFDRSEFTPGQDVARFLSECKPFMENESGAMLTITGHADATGTTSYNQALGMQRAERVKAYFTGQGLPPARMQTFSMGETEPVAENTTSEGRAENRRTEIIIKNQ